MIKISGIPIPLAAGFDITQTLNPILAKKLLRARDGTGIHQYRWRKYQTAINGQGIMPDGLDGLDLSVSHVIDCGISLSVSGAGASLTIPRAFRTDGVYAPAGMAVIGDNVQPTNVSMAGSVATLTAVSGATGYHIVYFPSLTCYITALDRSLDDATATWSWSLTAEEL
jgi:hypothetical protein